MLGSYINNSLLPDEYSSGSAAIGIKFWKIEYINIFKRKKLCGSVYSVRYFLIVTGQLVQPAQPAKPVN